jgi:IS5 family transposase
MPLAGHLTAANINDYGQLLGLVDRLPYPPLEVWADRGYDAKANRDGLAARDIVPMISRRRRPGQGRHRDPNGRHRWQIERTNSWLANHRRLLIRWDRRADIHQAFYTLACCLICWRRLQQSL